MCRGRVVVAGGTGAGGGRCSGRRTCRAASAGAVRGRSASGRCTRTAQCAPTARRSNWSRPRSGVNKTTGVGSPSRATNSSKEGPTPVPVRVSPTDRIRHHIDELFGSGRPLPEILEEVARLGAQLLMQAALEAEVTEFLGRDRYARAVACEDARPGSRNGYREVTVKTTAGPVGLARPKLRGTAETFASRLFGAHVTKTNALESLVIASFVRGLSVRDVEATLAEALGDQAAISKSTVSAICGQIKEEYERWARRRLDEVVLDYLFLDASFFRMHPGSPAEPFLFACGATTGGKPAFIGLAPGSGESADAWAAFLTNPKNGPQLGARQ